MWGLAAALFQRARREDANAIARARLPDAQPSKVAFHGATAALRAFERFPHLLPSDGAISSHIEWLAGHGASINDDDDLADSYLTICELARWQPMPAAAPIVAAPAIPDPTPSIDVAPVPEPPMHVETHRHHVAAPSKVKHEPSYAAQAFVDWARMNDHCGAHAAARIGELYAEHCREEGLVPLPTKTFRPALLQVQGVRKGLDDDYPAHLGNRRHRPTIWVIEPLATVSGEIPWTELPNRRVAA